jgi:hypothetical protein
VVEQAEGPGDPLAIFQQTIRPLGALKYENQPNYFLASFSGHEPTRQSFSYDYVFADWEAFRIEPSWKNGNPDAFLLGYQHTIGVGRNHNWAHAITILPEYIIPTHFVGGSAVYTFAWKPREKSPWTFTPIAGINRIDLESDTPGAGVKGIWRPYLAFNLFCTLSESWPLGIETDAFINNEKGEYLVLPLFNWRPVQHFFMQVGAGYYQIGSDCQATVMLRANILFPSRRRSR